MNFKEKLDGSPKLKKLVIAMISSAKHPRPRLWARWFVNPFFHKKGKGALICKKGSRIDVFPWHKFELGRNSIIENQCIVNNGAGDVLIGDNTMIGIGSIITGPARIGSHTLLGQRVFISGFNHGYKDVETDIEDQPLVKKETSVGDNTFIGTNAIVVAGVHIGNRCQIGAGSVVTKDIPDYCVAVGNPAKVIQRYDKESGTWK